MQEKLLVALPLQTVLFLTLRLTVGHPDPLPSPVPPHGLRPRSLPSQLLLPTRKPLLPPSFSSFRPDPKCSACCSAVQSPESSPSSLRAICSICLCPAHLASYPQRGLQDLVSEPLLLPPVLPPGGCGMKDPVTCRVHPAARLSPSIEMKTTNNKKEKLDKPRHLCPRCGGGLRRGGSSSPARNTWETHKSNIPRNYQWPQIEGKLFKRIVRD